ncbi:uncharacterized protein K489DRAFT_409276 [Dissoconium aciculare CBS 342.82]|uniref:Borealin N-terminal domain-containing protein n=1 Tax=Dissoconium aciculare CBS 342.82 TaxID=1314786 RepID=A0A6J3M5U4_9PEZI|nr:uncharacterized protein K489DRAFT_409276 [Dissoconium aciculare CBS 342.82]KAF1823415.1 hypothetical protein K489DRAFT_409276 [Dissoconium aciculare CBS 342.82]
MASRDVHTPEPVASSRSAGISEVQKQALVNNLQLEITERARKLRTQYALQAQGLRTRLEMRINRIPQALRKRTMQELVDEQGVRTKPAPTAPVPITARIPAALSVEPTAVPRKTTTKRKSEVMSKVDDKENNQPMEQEIANPKKRTKTAAANSATANIKATRTVSRRGGPTAVLSPRSHNSRTMPRSPIKSDNPVNDSRTTTTTSRTVVSANKPTAAAARAASRQAATRTVSATATDHDSRPSDASNNSVTTTIVKSSSTRAKNKASAATRTAVATTAKSSRAPAARKATAATRAGSGTESDSRNDTIAVSSATTAGGRKATTVTATTTKAATGRSLRKRN